MTWVLDLSHLLDSSAQFGDTFAQLFFGGVSENPTEHQARMDSQGRSMGRVSVGVLSPRCLYGQLCRRLHTLGLDRGFFV